MGTVRYARERMRMKKERKRCEGRTKKTGKSRAVFKSSKLAVAPRCGSLTLPLALGNKILDDTEHPGL